MKWAGAQGRGGVTFPGGVSGFGTQCHGVVDIVVFSHNLELMFPEVFSNLIDLWLCGRKIPNGMIFPQGLC